MPYTTVARVAYTSFVRGSLRRNVSLLQRKLLQQNLKVVESTLKGSSDHNRFKFLWHALQFKPTPFLTRKPFVAELNFEINRIES